MSLKSRINLFVWHSRKSILAESTLDAQYMYESIVRAWFVCIGEFVSFVWIECLFDVCSHKEYERRLSIIKMGLYQNRFCFMFEFRNGKRLLKKPSLTLVVTNTSSNNNWTCCGGPTNYFNYSIEFNNFHIQTPWRQYCSVLAQFIRKIESNSKNGTKEANSIHNTTHTSLCAEQLTEADLQSISAKDMQKLFINWTFKQKRSWLHENHLNLMPLTPTFKFISMWIQEKYGKPLTRQKIHYLPNVWRPEDRH